MATTSNFLFATGTSGDAMTTGNSGATSVTVASGAVARLAAVAAVDGALGAEWVGSASAGTSWARFPAPVSAMTSTVELDFTVPALPASGEVTVAMLRTASTTVWSLRVTSTGTVKLVNSTDTLSWKIWGPATAGMWLRVSISTTVDTASTGTFTARAYPTYARLPLIDPLVVTGVDMGTAPVTAVYVGYVTGSLASFVVRADNLRVTDALAEVGPISHGPVTTLAGWVSAADATSVRGAWFSRGDYGALTVQASAAGHVTQTGSASASAYDWATGLVVGLDPDTLYTVTLLNNGVPVAGSAVTGRTLATARKAFTAVTGSCQSSPSDPPILGMMAGLTPDFFVHQGDLHYADTTSEVLWRNAIQDALRKPQITSLISTAGMRWIADNHDSNGAAPDATYPWHTWGLPACAELTGRSPAYEAWSHANVKMIHIDPWTYRDVTDPAAGGLANGDPMKRMLGVTQEAWLCDQIASATEDFILIMSHFPLYMIRFGNFLAETARLKTFFGNLPAAQRAKCIAIGGDSHDVRASSLATKSVWGIPTLNASPFSQTGAGGTSSDASPADWDIAIISPTPTNPAQYASKFGVSAVAGGSRTFIWSAIDVTGATVGTWSRTLNVAPAGARLYIKTPGGVTPAQGYIETAGVPTAALVSLVQ